MRPTGGSGALPDRPPHRHAWRPSLGQVRKLRADLLKAGLSEHRLGAEEREVVVHPLARRPGVRLHGGGATQSGVVDGRPDHRDRDAPAAVATPHGDARYDPRRHIVDGRRGARILDDREVVAWSERDEPDRLAPLVRNETGCVLPAPCQLGEHGAASILARAGGPAGDAERAFLRGGVTREQVPAGGPPRAFRDDLDVVDVRRRERSDL
jgi:hypothetical protein